MRKVLLFIGIMIPLLFSSYAYATDHSGDINSNETWTVAGNPHRITGNLYVNSGYTLTIEPGCNVKFAGDYELRVYGVLKADGTSANHITFTSDAATPAPGDWQEINFYNAESGCLLDYCDIRYGGNYEGSIKLYGAQEHVTISNCLIEYSDDAGIEIANNSSPSISNCTIQNNNSYGIFCYEGDAYPLISDCSIQDNGSYAIRTHGDNIKDITGTMTITGNSNNAILVDGDHINNGTWNYHNVPYVIVDNLYIDDGETLTIAENNTIKFQSSKRLFIYGTLIADGSAANLITFTSAQATPAAGDWYNLNFNNCDPGCLLDYCNISYGGYNYGLIYINIV